MINSRAEKKARLKFAKEFLKCEIKLFEVLDFQSDMISDLWVHTGP